MAEQNSTLYLSQHVRASNGIPKAYFEYWAGDAMICTRYNSASCEKIVQEGLFDAAFKNGRLAAAHKGIVDYASAAGYCKMMLDTHGGCEQSLATSYQTSVNKRNNMCGKLSLRTGDLLVNPQNR